MESPFRSERTAAARPPQRMTRSLREVEANRELQPIGGPVLAAEDLATAVEILDACPGAARQEPVEKVDGGVIELRVGIGRVEVLFVRGGAADGDVRRESRG